MRVTVAIGENALPNLAELARKFGDQAEFVTGPIDTPDGLAELTSDADALVVGLHRMSAEHFAALSPSVKIVGRTGVGLDTIDLPAAAQSNTAVVYQPTYATAEVATHAAAMFLALQRRLPQADAVVRSTTGWGGIRDVGRVWALDEASIAVLGCGRIGQALIARLQPFVREIRVFDPFLSEPVPGTRTVDNLEDLIDGADGLSLHLPLNDETRHLIARRELYALRPGAVLVNVSRGGLIDEGALADALADGQISGAGLDVFEQEPLASTSTLRTAPNLLLSPHMAWYTESALRRLGEWTVDDVLTYLERGGVDHGRLAGAPVMVKD